MRKILMAAIAILGMSASAQAGPEPFIGEVEVLPYSFCPNGFLPADGRLLAITDNEALYALYGIKYGGDGVNTFGIPYLPLKKALHKKTMMVCVAVAGIFPSQN
jgi:microcystin-dependent protein